MKIPTLRSVFKICYQTLCIALCSFQILNILISYFEYKSVTRSKIYEPKYVPYPKLHVCFLSIPDMLNISAIESMYNISKSDYGPIGELNLMDYISIKDMLTYTPNMDIHNCAYRDADGNAPIYDNHTECMKKFSMKKYLNGQYVCYEIAVSNMFNNNNISADSDGRQPDALISFRSVSTSLQYDRSLFEIRFKGQLASGRKIRPSISMNRFPVIGNLYAPTYYKDARADVSIHISCSNYTQHKLGYPYDNFICGDADASVNSVHVHDDCLDACIETLSLTYFDRMPFTSFYEEYSYRYESYVYDKKIISPKMLSNNSISKLWNNFHAVCQSKCIIYSCLNSFCLSIGHADMSVPFRGEDSSSSVRVESASSPDAHVEYVPQTPALDTLIYILSSFGTWFGLIIIKFDPIHILDMIKDGICKMSIKDTRIDKMWTHLENNLRVSNGHKNFWRPVKQSDASNQNVHQTNHRRHRRRR